MTNMADMSKDVLVALERDLTRDFELQKSNRLALDLTRGKPAPEQLALSDGMADVLAGDFFAADGTDTRNYGGLRGLPEARALGAELLETPVENVICHGNSSLTLMYIVTATALNKGLWGDKRRWNLTSPVKVLTPVPGFDRHFTLCQSFGIEMVNVPMTDSGPDMREANRLAAEDDSIKGIWCVPKYANPTGIIYSDECVNELARLPATAAADDFVVFWDNAYAVHDFQFPRAPLAPMATLATDAGTADQIVMFASTSKITYAGGGLGFLAASTKVLDVLEKQMRVFSICPDKVNQLRHARFLKGRLEDHMAQHAALVKPKFELVEQTLRDGLEELDIARWTSPAGGYFVSLDTRPGLAKSIEQLAGETGLALTPAGTPFPSGRDPEDRNLRIAPTFAHTEDLSVAMSVMVLCIKLATVRQQLGPSS
ncbi:MAG: aminotransferase class I/II-fold pyridoxal phosphate-dependent enzyme [Gammaproteobacteria bacterium]|nr:aminotransferase class I/II-fold pyridoxal phosphate-dependent enzyme [Gammaproteobacteria bacterium]